MTSGLWARHRTRPRFVRSHRNSYRYPCGADGKATRAWCRSGANTAAMNVHPETISATVTLGLVCVAVLNRTARTQEAAISRRPALALPAYNPNVGSRYLRCRVGTDQITKDDYDIGMVTIRGLGLIL